MSVECQNSTLGCVRLDMHLEMHVMRDVVINIIVEAFK